jgi:hypothetical protein
MRKFAFLVLAVAAPCALAAQAPSAATVVRGGLAAVTFTTPQGKVRVYLPDDMMAGDHISGTVVADPAGEGDVDVNKNANALSEFTVSVNGHTLTLRALPRMTGAGITSVFTGQVASGPATVALMSNGKVIASAPLPVRPAPDPAISSGVQLPVLAQAGQPLLIRGNFDGDMQNTKCSVAGAEAPILAESPRQAVVRIPAGTPGPTEITVTENGAATNGTVRVISIKLSAGRTKLVSGEQTTLEVRVEGLQGLTAPPGQPPLRVTVTDLTPAVVQIVGQPQRSDFTIAPADVGADGSYTRTMTLQGVVAGDFQVSALLLNAVPIDMRKIKNPVSLEGYSLDELEATLEDLRARKALDAANAGTSQKYLADKIKIVKSAIRKVDKNNAVAKDQPGDE